MTIHPLPKDQESMRRFVAIARRAVINRKDLSLRDKSVAGRLLDHVHTNSAHRKFGKAWPPMAHLADLEGACERTIRRSISRIAAKGLFSITYGHSLGANHASTYDPEWDALLNVEPAPEPDISPQSQEPEMSSKPDNPAVETGQNCPPNLSRTSGTNKPTLTHPDKSGGDSSDSQISNSVESLTLEQARNLLERWETRRGTRSPRLHYGNGKLVCKRELERRIKSPATAEAEAIPSPAEQASEGLGGYLRHRSHDLYGRLKRSGNFRPIIADWAEAELANPGAGRSRIDAYILRDGPPKSALQRSANGQATAKKHQTDAAAVNAWHSDLWRIDGGAVVLDALRIGANPIPGQASAAEFEQPGAGLPVILDWWQAWADAANRWRDNFEDSGDLPHKILAQADDAEFDEEGGALRLIEAWRHDQARAAA